MKRYIFILIAGLIISIADHGNTQNVNQDIQLLDKMTLNPIVGAHYKYHHQEGISDIRGIIRLHYQKDDSLFLSHVSYGDWYLEDGKVAKGIETGVVLKQKEILTTQPISVIALRPLSDKAEFLNLEYQDKLAHDAGAILNQSPMINSIRKSGSYGFDPVMRGFKYDQLNVIIDDAQVAAAACPNRMDPPTSQIAPNMMENVEIFKGPHSFRYGTSLGGTINFKSTPLQFPEEQKFYGRLSAGYESNGKVYRSEGVFGSSNRIYDLSLFGSWSKGDDYKDGEQIPVPAGFERGSFGIQAGTNVTENHQLKILGTRNIANNTDFPSLPMDLISDKTTLVNFQHSFAINEPHLLRWSSTIYLTHVDHLMNNLYKDMQPRNVNAHTDAITRSFGGRTEGTWAFQQGELFSGLDLRNEKAEGERTREFLLGPNAGKIKKDNVWNGAQSNRVGIFGEYHHTSKSLKLSFSGRLEYNQAKATDPDVHFSEDDVVQINPNLSIGGLYKFGNRISVGLWLGHAQRSGSLTERYINSLPVGVDAYELIGNPDLDPEVNNQIDLLLGYKKIDFSLDLTLFASFLNNYISSKIDTSFVPVMPGSPGVRRFTNIENAFISGFEINLQQGLFEGAEHRVQVAFTYARDNVRNEPLPEIPPLDLRYSIVGNYLSHSLRPSLTFRYVAKQERISETYGENKSPAYFTLDLSVVIQMSKKVGLSLGVLNLFDKAYYEHLNRYIRGTNRPIYARGRNLYATLFLDLM